MPFTNNPAVRLLMTLAALVIILAGIKTSQQLVVPFLLSLFIAIVCQPVINFLQGFKIPKVLAVAFVIIVILTLGFSLASLVGQSLNSFSQDLPEYKAKLQDEIGWFTNQLASFNIHLNRQQFVEYFDPGAAMSLATNMLSGLGNTLANAFLILITIVFMLFEADAVTDKLRRAWRKPTQHIESVYCFLRSVNHYLAIKTIISIITGILAGLLCWGLGVDYFVLWGVLAFLFNYIPNIGSIIAAIPVVLLSFIQVSPLAAGIAALGYLSINTIMGNFVEPKYMGKGMGLSSLVVFLSLIFWGWLLGTVGMLLSVPLTMVVKIATEASESTRWFAVLLSNQQELEFMEEKHRKSKSVSVS
ncbi:AI-2E family transporter [Catenovulum adriaticum]|uniref:AI-2E family transporter n=1 Tax=Catenovulum adriaticum TaxID=2984846 RepID=A0ABY7AVK0_9ALTE|nr:AI-2E family transporter [Catenovulum sp. TS8]WAJ72334.1 AI-2E family transporter [Catenovulum sp. TS8]